MQLGKDVMVIIINQFGEMENKLDTIMIVKKKGVKTLDVMNIGG